MGLISKITPSNQAYYYHFDGIGSTIGISDSTGNIVNKYAYDAFGKVINQMETISNPFKYVGQFGVMDEGNGLLYMRARYYDPDVGRFISKDPIGFAGGDLNFYAYVGNNPVNFVDPLGLLNPTKAIAALANAANAGRLYASGVLKLAGAAGLIETGVGAPAGLAAALLGTWNIYSATAAQSRAIQQWNEALQEDWSAATWRNLLGVLPYGQRYDDPCEPTPSQFLQEKKHNLWELIKELGTMSW